MRDFIKSMISFPWALSLLSAQQLVSTLTPPAAGEQAGQAVAAFDSITAETRKQFSDPIRIGFDLGDILQRGVMNLTFGLTNLKSFNPAGVMRMTCEAIQRSGGTLMQLVQMAGSPQESASGSFIPRLNDGLKVLVPSLARFSTLFITEPKDHFAWSEFQNKWEVIQLVGDVDKLLDLTASDDDVPLTQLIERAYALEPFPALWAVEGLGAYYADRSSMQGKMPRNLLNNDRTSGLPDKSLTMLHAGMGLSFARHLMRMINPRSADVEVRATLQRFIALCKDNARKGYVGCALESLGLVTRVLFPEMVTIIDRQLFEVDLQTLSYFWHGVGRAIYFSPGLLLPGCGSPWEALETSWREAPHELGLLNAMAGVAWGVALVNIRQPEIIANLLNRYREQLSGDSAFSNGVVSSIIMRRDMTPHDPSIARFCQYQPDPSNRRLVELWHRDVKCQCEEALHNYYPVLKQHDRLEEVFHYQSLSKLVGRSGPTAGDKQHGFYQPCRFV